MRILLSDASGLTSRQCVTLLGRAGHEVHLLAPGRAPLARWTRHAHALHRVPSFGVDPSAWWSAALDVVDRVRPDVLLPTQEQAPLVSVCAGDLEPTGTRTVVAPFAAFLLVQDKLAGDRTLRAAGLRRPRSWVATTPAALAAGVGAPAYLKAPIGTASTSVHLVDDLHALSRAVAALERSGAFVDGGVLVEEPVSGPLLMVQAVADRGRLVALHAVERTRQGPGGGASAKTSRHVPGLAAEVEALVTHLGWHGALSLDAILDGHGPVWIDVNPRLVEPGSAAAAGLDLLGPLLDLATGGPSRSPASPGRSGVRTHQLLLAVLAAAERRGRRGVAAELAAAAARTGPYSGSHEELTPARRDPLAAVPVVAAAAVCLARPVWGQRLAGSAVGGYALSPQGWRSVLRAAAGRGSATGPALGAP